MHYSYPGKQLHSVFTDLIIFSSSSRLHTVIMLRLVFQYLQLLRCVEFTRNGFKLQTRALQWELAHMYSSITF